MLRRLATLVPALALACGPSLARLDRGHHYNEAICGAEEGALPKEQVAKVIRRALDPALHVAVVPREQLAGVIGEGLPELDRVALLRITHDSNAIPLSIYSARVALRRGDVSLPLDEAGLRTFAAVFKEPVPEPRTVGPGALESAAHGIAAVGAVVMTVATLGIFGNLLRGVGPGPSSHTEYPTKEEIRRAAPRATKLYDAVAHLHGDCPQRSGATCRTLALVERPPEEPADLAVHVDLWYASMCSRTGIHDRFTIPLPPGPTLEARLAAVFGQDMRRLSELPARPTAAYIPPPTLPSP